MAAPMLMPPEYGVPLPQPVELPPSMASVVRELRAHPAGEHALMMFREERR
jgi:glutathione S-transferase